MLLRRHGSASLEARVAGAEATLGAVGKAEERENATLVAKNAGSVTRGGPAHDATSQRCVERVASTTNEERRRKCVSCNCARAKPRVLAPARCFAPVLDRSAAGSVRGNDARVSSPGRVCVASRKPDRCRGPRGRERPRTQSIEYKFTRAPNEGTARHASPGVRGPDASWRRRA